MKNHLEKFEKAVKHFGDTRNPLPLLKLCARMDLVHRFCQQLGVPVPPADSDAWNI